MCKTSRPLITKILLDARAGVISEKKAADRVFEIAYAELRRVADSLMRGEREAHTLQPTALVHETYCRLVDRTQVSWQSRAHFFGIAARAMRQVLIEHARRRGADKHGGDLQKVTLDDNLGNQSGRDIDVLKFDEALIRLSQMDGRMARIVELRAFTGMSMEEIARTLKISRRTVQYDWRMARMWLGNELAQGVQQ